MGAIRQVFNMAMLQQMHSAYRLTLVRMHLFTHTQTRWFLWFTGTFHRRNGSYSVQTVCAIALHLNLALTVYFPSKKLTLYDL